MTALTLSDFRTSLGDAAPAPHLPPALAALWWAHRGEWGKAHGIVQEASGADAAWVHAYLHRQEGDTGNAAYWYRQAGRPATDEALEAEWEKIAAALSEH